MGDGVRRIDVKPTQSLETTTGSSPAGSLQELPPYSQQFGAMQATSSAPMCPPYNQQFGSVQLAPAAPISPPYNQQVGSVQPASADPIGGFFNPHPEQQSYPNPQQVAPHPPPTTDEEANTTEQDSDWNYICFDYSGDYEWYDLRGKGICWFILLLLFWLNVGFFLFLVACAILQMYACCLLLLGSDTSSSSDNDRRRRNARRGDSGSRSAWFFQYPVAINAVLLRTTSFLDLGD